MLPARRVVGFRLEQIWMGAFRSQVTWFVFAPQDVLDKDLREVTGAFTLR